MPLVGLVCLQETTLGELGKRRRGNFLLTAASSNQNCELGKRRSFPTAARSTEILKQIVIQCWPQFIVKTRLNVKLSLYKCELGKRQRNFLPTAARREHKATKLLTQIVIQCHHLTVRTRPNAK